MRIVIALSLVARIASADDVSPGITEPDPASRCNELDPDPANPGHSMRLDVLIRVQEACRPLVQAFGSVAARTSVDRADTEAEVGAALEAHGEAAWNPHGFQFRGAADGRIGAGPSTSPTATVEGTFATPMGWLTSEVFGRATGHRLPSLFEGRVRAPGRFDEVGFGMRTSLVSAEAGALNAVILPVSVERIDTRLSELDAGAITQWRWRAGIVDTANNNGKFASRVRFLDFRGEDAGDVSLAHFVLLHAELSTPDGSYATLRFGAGKFAPNDVADSLGNFPHYEGEVSSFAKHGDALVGLGFTSDYAITSDGLIDREHRLRGEFSYPVGGGALGGAAFLARTHTFDPRMVPFETDSQWTGGVRTSYGRKVKGLDVTVMTEAARSFHVRVGPQRLTGEPGFAAQASLMVATSKGTRATPNRVAE